MTGRTVRVTVERALRGRADRKLISVLAPALQLRYPESTERQTKLLEGLLAAVYPKGLDAATATTIRAACPQSNALTAVVLGMIGNTIDRMAIVDEFTRNRLRPPEGGGP